MTIKVQSDEPIDGLTLKKIIDIFSESKCPHESLSNSIERYSAFDGDTVTIGAGKIFFETINIGGINHEF